MKHIFKYSQTRVISLFIILLSIFLLSCEKDLSLENPLAQDNFVGFSFDQKVSIPEGETVNVEVKIYSSKSEDKDRVIGLFVHSSSTADPQYYSVPSTITIPAGSKEGKINVSVTSNNLGSGKTIILEITPQDNLQVATSYTGSISAGNLSIVNDNLKITVLKRYVLNPLKIQINTDRWGSETVWELYNANDLINPIATGGPYSDYSKAGSYPQIPEILDLPDGNYIFVVYDLYGDGMDSGSGHGYYRLVTLSPEGDEVTQIAKNGAFTDYDVVEFNLPL